MSIVLPSIITANYLEIKSNIKRLIESGLEELHLDVMDGCFVPSITFGHKLVQDIHNEFPNLKLDAHLMTINPIAKIEKFIEAGTTSITVHIETVSIRELTKIKEITTNANVKLGIAVGYETNVKEALKVLKKIKNIDQVLVMSVKQGAGGQKFDEDSLDKVKTLKEYREKNNLDFKIEIDGGINTITYNLAVSCGVDRLVIGNGIFKNNNIEENYKIFTQEQEELDKE